MLAAAILFSLDFLKIINKITGIKPKVKWEIKRIIGKI